MTLVAVNSTPTACPDCTGQLSIPIASRSRPGMVVQTCRNYQACGRSVWSRVGTVVTERVVDDGSRHGRFQLPSTSEPEPAPLNTKPNWFPMSRLARHELAAINQADRKLAAAGGDR